MNDIIILGCGLSGMITALSLAKYNIPSTIVEAKTATDVNFFEDIRSTALNATSKDYLQKIGIWESLSPKCGPINEIYVADNKGKEMLHFSRQFTLDNQIMGYLVENTIFKKCLFELVKSNKHISILEGTEYKDIVNTENGCDISLSSFSPDKNGNKKPDYTLSCKLLIPCDGRNSKAKNLFFSNEIEKEYKQTALTFHVHHQKKHEGCAVEHFMPTGPFAILPLKDEKHSSIVWTLSAKHAEAITALPIEEFTYLVQENFGEFLGKVQINSKIAAFPLKATATRKYYNKSIVLVSDTAHIIHPLAGQGLNQGIKDIECLVDLIKEKQQNLIFFPMLQDILETYQKLRQADNENMLLITDSINSIFNSKSRIFHSARQLGFKIIENITPLKKSIIKYAMGKRGRIL